MAEPDAAPGGEVVVYETPEGDVRVDVRLERDTVWLTQRQMAALFEKGVRTVNEHIGNVFREGELGRQGTIRKFRVVRQEGSRKVAREIEHYNLDVVISVGYRVKSHRGVRFRQWATRTLRDHLVRGYTLNERRHRGASARKRRERTSALAGRFRPTASARSARRPLSLAPSGSPRFRQTAKSGIMFFKLTGWMLPSWPRRTCATSLPTP